jgi:histidinol-phosphate aminotransferase
MPIRPRPQLERVPPVPHGGFHSAHRAERLDFSSNVNPFGPSPRIWDAMRAVPIGQHPDPRAAPLREVLAEIENISPRRLIVGNGSVELIYHLAVAYLRAGDRVLIVEPTFGEYAAAAAMMGAEVIPWHTHPEENFPLDIDALLRLAHQVKPRLLFLCNPNNPTGTYVERDVIEQLLRGCPDTLLVLDEAFIRFVADAWSPRELHTSGNLLVLRSLTKDHALTGLRVGYALATPTIIDALEKVQPPWSVNALAQAAAIAALRNEGHLRASLDSLVRAKNDLVNDLARLGFMPLPSRVHFFLLPVPSAAEFARKLLERNILVRDGTSFGLPRFVRIATRKPEENARLVSALEKLDRKSVV